MRSLQLTAIGLLLLACPLAARAGALPDIVGNDLASEERWQDMESAAGRCPGLEGSCAASHGILNPASQQAGFTAVQCPAGGNPSPDDMGNGVVVSGLQQAGIDPAQSGIFSSDNSISFPQGSYAPVAP